MLFGLTINEYNEKRDKIVDTTIIIKNKYLKWLNVVKVSATIIENKNKIDKVNVRKIASPLASV